VKEPDADERHAELGRRLQVVAGEHAEPAGVDRQALVERELHGEVGDEEVATERLLVPPRGRPELRLERPLRLVDAPDERLVLGSGTAVLFPAASVAVALPVPLPLVWSPTFAVNEPEPLKALLWTVPLTLAPAVAVTTT